MINPYKNIILAVSFSILLTAICVLGGYSYYQSNKISALDKTIEECTLAKATEESNNVTLSSVIHDLNAETMKLTINEKVKDKEYKTKILKLTSEVRKVGSNDCNDIKIKLDDIRNTDYTRLLN